MRLWILLAVISAGATASAQAQTLPTSAPAPASAPAAPEPPPAAHGIEGVNDDAAIDTVVFSSTALGNPKGSFQLSDWESIVLGGTYALSDNFQISLASVPPVVKDQPFFALGSAKLSIPIGNHLHVAGIGTLGYTQVICSGCAETSYLGGVIQGVGTWCFDAGCQSTVTGFIGTGFAISQNSGTLPLVFGGSIVARIAKHVKLMAEVEGGGAAALTTGATSQLLDGVVLVAGARIYSRVVSVDVAFLRPTSAETPLGLFVIPVLAFSARFGG
jgi:hypothetical protein